MRIFGIELSRARSVTAAPVPVQGSGGWINVFRQSVVREPFTGAWQQNQEIAIPSTLSYAAVFACVTLIAGDVGKLRLRLVERDDDGVWPEVHSAAFSPVLRRPNRYQIINKFLEQWIVSKLTHGNTYVLKQRDARGVVVAMYVLDPQQVTPMVAPDGSVYYQLGKSELAGIPEFDEVVGGPVVVPAREIIHDLMVPLFHPLIGVTPIYACALAAVQGQKIQQNSTTFFAGGSNPGGVLTAPGSIDQGTADRLKKYWDDNYTGANVGKVAVLGDGLKYEPMSVNAVDAQLIEQLKWTTETVCSCFHVPAALIDSSHQPPYANSEPLVQQYYSQALQTLIVALENSLDDGLELATVPGHVYGTELDIDDLIWLDVTTRTKAAGDAVVGGVLSPNESRFRYFGVGPVKGGESPYLQQQNFSLAALAERDADQPFSKPTPSAPAENAPADDDDEALDLNRMAGLVLKGIVYGR